MTDEQFTAAHWQLTKDLVGLTGRLIGHIEAQAKSHFDLVDALRGEAGYESRPAPVFDRAAIEKARLDVERLERMFNNTDERKDEPHDA